MAFAIAQALWLALPVSIAGILHMVVVRMNLLPRLRVPLDGGMTLGGRPLLGANKTWRGFIFMVFAAAALGAVQGFCAGAWAAERGLEAIALARVGHSLSLDGHTLALTGGHALLNATLGLGYALGELPNSFFKRRLGIESGMTTSSLLGAVFFVVDQADSVLVGLAMGAVLFGISWSLVWVGTVCLSLLHLALNAALYAMRLRENL